MNLFQPSIVPLLDDEGVTVPGGKRYFYLTNSNTLATIYADAEGTSTLTNPVVALGDGRTPAVYLDSDVTYRYVETDENDVSLGVDIDPVRGYDVSNLLDSAVTAAENAASAALIAATGDVAAAIEIMSTIISTSGSAAAVAQIDSSGWKALVANPTDLSLEDLVVVRRGFDNTGSTTYYADTLKLTKRVREPYPDHEDFTADRQALSDYVYSTDSVYGATNSSAVVSPKPIANWVMADRQRVTDGNCFWEMVAFHRDARQGRQVACVRVRGNDGTTQTDWQTVSSTALSTYCDDANAPETFSGTLDVSSLADGGFWLEAEVYPWVGSSASVLKSEDNETNGLSRREFTRRFFRKDASATQYVAVASTGNDSTGVVDTTEATAIATPCLTVAGALKKAHDTLGTSDGALDVVQIVIVDSVDLGSVPFTGSYKQDISAVKVTRATGTTRAAADITTTAAFNPDFDSHTMSFNEAALMFEDCSLTWASATHTIQGSGGIQLAVIFKDCNLDFGSNVNLAIRSTSNLNFYGCTVTNVPASSTTPFGFSTAGQVRIFRGCTVDMNNQTFEGYLTLGNDITGSKGQAYEDTRDGVIVYNNKFLSPNGTNSGILFDSAEGLTSSVTHDLFGAVVQNLVEWTSTSSNPSIRVTGDDDEGSLLHFVMHHNSCPGSGVYGRWNLFYDEDATVLRTHELISMKGNIGAQLNIKGDIFDSDASKVGNFAIVHGVGSEGNYTIDDANAPSTEHPSYAGLNSTLGGGDAEFTNDQSTSAGPVAGSGGGTYTLESTSPAKEIVSTNVLSFKLDGSSRTGTQDAGAF